MTLKLDDTEVEKSLGEGLFAGGGLLRPKFPCSVYYICLILYNDIYDYKEYLNT